MALAIPETIKQVSDFIINNFLIGSQSPISPDASLLEQGIIDSTGVLELVNFLEEKYQISVSDAELLPENLDSLNAIAKFIQTKST